MSDVIVRKPALFARLREATSAHHQRLEKVMSLDRFADRERYVRLLQRMWAFYSPTERNLAGLPWGEAGIDFADRLKTGWLEQDLNVLRAQLPDGRAEDVPKPESLAEGIGCLYVLEGATLGGRIISQHLAKFGITPVTGGAFYDSYGDSVGDRWASFKKAAGSYCESEERISQAVAGAVKTFQQFEAWFAKE